MTMQNYRLRITFLYRHKICKIAASYRYGIECWNVSSRSKNATKCYLFQNYRSSVFSTDLKFRQIVLSYIRLSKKLKFPLNFNCNFEYEIEVLTSCKVSRFHRRQMSFHMQKVSWKLIKWFKQTPGKTSKKSLDNYTVEPEIYQAMIWLSLFYAQRFFYQTATNAECNFF